jgi:hypothetical protein
LEKQKTRSIEDLGAPAFQLGGFSLWVHGWEKEDSNEDWLDVTARFVSPDVGDRNAWFVSPVATVTISGSRAEVSDFEAGLSQIENFYGTSADRAIFESTEPGFKIELTTDTQDGDVMNFTVLMTPGFWEEYRYTEHPKNV